MNAPDSPNALRPEASADGAAGEGLAVAVRHGGVEIGGVMVEAGHAVGDALGEAEDVLGADGAPGRQTAPGPNERRTGPIDEAPTGRLRRQADA